MNKSKKLSTELCINDDKEVSISIVREIFKEMFQKQQNDILKLISESLKISNDRIDGLNAEISSIKESYKTLFNENESRKVELENVNERLKKIRMCSRDIEESLNFFQDIQEKKVHDLEEKIHNKTEIGQTEKIKIRQLEDRQRNNLRLNGLKENESESWEQTELKVIKVFKNNLNIKGVTIERAHRPGKISSKNPRTIVMKLLNYKEKIKVLKNPHKLKRTNIYINEDYSFDTMVIRKKLLEEMKVNRNNGIYSIVIYDKLIVKEFRKNQNAKI